MEGTFIYGDIIKDNIFWNQNDPPVRAYFGCVSVDNTVQKSGSKVMGLYADPAQNILYPWFQRYPEDKYTFSTCFDNKTGFFEIGVDPGDADLQPTFVSSFDGKFYSL